MLEPIAAELQERCACDFLRVRWQARSALWQQIAALDSVEVLPVSSGQPRRTCPDRITVRVRGWRNGRRTEHLLFGVPECRETAYRVARSLRTGTVIAPDDVVREDGWVPPSALSSGEAEAVGSYVLRSRSRGDWIRRGDLREAPMVLRGGPVRIVCASGGLQLVCRGSARVDGWLGDRLAVRADGAEKDCEATVTGAGEVRIDLEENLP
jgi:flagella basal body P-ring formation protein FlgA